MQVDSEPATSEKDKEMDNDASTSSSKKYQPPVDAQTGDLIPEATVYLRLLLILMNLNAGKLEEVSRAVN
jgi:26S proteasome regulatory subunit N3